MNNRGITFIEVLLSLFLFATIVILLSPIIFNSTVNINKSFIKYEMEYVLSNLIESLIAYNDFEENIEFYNTSIEDLINQEKEIKANGYSFILKVYKENTIKGLDNYIGEIYYETFNYKSEMSIQLQAK